MAKKQFYRANDLKTEVLNSKNQVFERGIATGLTTLDEIISLKVGYHTLLFSFPHTGKSVLTLDMLVSIAEREGKTIAVFSPEFRTKEELVLSIVQQKIGKTMYGLHAREVTDKELIEALDFCDKHFIILERPERTKELPLNGLSITDIFTLCKEAQVEYKTKIDILFIDPLNYISRDKFEKDMSIADYMLHLHDTIAEFSKLLKVHTILSAHCRDIDMLEDKETGIKWYPVAQPADVMGGQSHFRGASQIISLWRCPAGIIEKSTGVPYPENAIDVICQKAKPMGSGRLGKRRIYWNPSTHKMEELINGKRYAANEYEAEQKLHTPTNNMPVSKLF